MRKTVVFSILGLSLLFCLIQVTLALSFTPRSLEPLSRYLLVKPPVGWDDSVNDKSLLLRQYLRLNNWDSLRYFEIAKNGYHTVSPQSVTQDDMENFRTNCSFFPGYPLLTRLCSNLIGTSIQVSLLLVAHLATLIFWIYFFSVLKLWKVDTRTSLIASILVLAFPTSFYMAMGYSESLFLAFLMGFIYWTERALVGPARGRIWVVTALHGFGMCATRLMGLPVLAYPLLRSFFASKPQHFHPISPRTFQAGLASLVSSLGCFLFFLYCHVEFGRWDLYMYLQHIGGNVVHQPWAVLQPLNYLPHYFFENTEVSLDRSIAPMTLIGLVIAYRKDPKWLERSGFYFSILSMHYLLTSSKANADFIAVARHGHTTFILFVLVFVQILHPRLGSLSRLKTYSIAGACVLLFTAQFYLTYRFVHGRWVE